MHRLGKYLVVSCDAQVRQLSDSVCTALVGCGGCWERCTVCQWLFCEHNAAAQWTLWQLKLCKEEKQKQSSDTVQSHLPVLRPKLWMTGSVLGPNEWLCWFNISTLWINTDWSIVHSVRLVSSTASSHAHSTRTLTHHSLLGMCSDRLVSSTASSHSTRTLTHWGSLGMCKDRFVSSTASSHSTKTLTHRGSLGMCRQVGEHHSQFTYSTKTHCSSLGMCSDRLVSSAASSLILLELWLTVVHWACAQTGWWAVQPVHTLILLELWLTACAQTGWWAAQSVHTLILPELWLTVVHWACAQTGW